MLGRGSPIPEDARILAIEGQLNSLDGVHKLTVSQWLGETSGVLRGGFGAEHTTIAALGQVSWYPNWGPAPEDTIRRQFESGRAEARGILIGALHELALTAPPTQLGSTAASDPRRVFVVHGRNTRLRDDLFAFLRALGLLPMPWSTAVAATGSASPYVGEVLDAAFQEAQAIVILLTPDDEARLRAPFHRHSDPTHEVELTPQPRPNVLFEAGMALGRSPNQTVLIEVGALRGFSDVGGRHVVRLENSSISRQELADRLRSAGCPVSFEGTDWQTVGYLALREDE